MTTHSFTPHFPPALATPTTPKRIDIPRMKYY
jgi:hypothetical protein